MVAFNVMVAVCENMGIGKNGNLPWRLKTEMEHFTRMTTKCKDNNRKNIVLMGRKTWDSIPKRYKPLKDRINFILSRSDLDLKAYTDTYHFKNLDAAVKKLENDDFKRCYEKVWVIGGSQVYKMCMESEYFNRLYITIIQKEFDCDTFFPKLPDNLKKINDPDVPEGVHEENGIKYVFNVYQKPDFASA